MENQMQVFQNEQFGQLRAVMLDGEPWFVGRDVARALGYDDTGKAAANAVTRHADAEDRGVTEIVTPGGKQKMTIINESGLYSLILGSKLSEAKKFKRWVTAEVLPSIRKHGAYMTPDTLEGIIADPEFGIKLLTALKKEQDKRKALEDKVEADAPKVAFAERVASADRDIKVGDFAKLMSCDGYQIGRNTMFKLLRDHGFLDSWNKPFQKYMNMGIFSVYEILKGNRLCVVTYITPKGQIYLHDRLFQSPSYLTTSCVC